MIFLLLILIFSIIYNFFFIDIFFKKININILIYYIFLCIYYLLFIYYLFIDFILLIEQNDPSGASSMGEIIESLKDRVTPLSTFIYTSLVRKIFQEISFYQNISRIFQKKLNIFLIFLNSKS